MTAEDLIKAALRKITVFASGETPEPEDLADGLFDLQNMLHTWAAKRILIFASTKEDVTLQSSKFLYTWGTGGNINTSRPHQVTGASIVDSEGITHDVDIISEGKYRMIAVKGTLSRPYALYFHPTFPLAEIYLYPVPQDVETLKLESFKPFTETSSFDSLKATLSFPVNYSEALIYNLAVRLASGYGKTVSLEVATIATDSYNAIVGVNAANQVEEVAVSVPAGINNAGRYSINSDTYH
jgi:hypothetical protein